ncbi:MULTISPECIES: DUF1656 domain-containing protein [Sphingosinicellaceae]|uniref:DUF1656 domain-containing protein n=1 Tax=Sphingosinicellaceae TaxID=2820280 RepID=UPI001C1DD34A|nr:MULTISPECIES: DUF1656 domain-containing protein [Polymorphobacter]QYE33811.1 DUF1656 domain-containing protein [Polymorphobacter sp. PAMC 29334]UAJ08964.1 DUF1656 domain-containing protein [Polymorphobacter megasporae]
MIGEISISGVYLPALLVLAIVATVLTGIATRLLTLVSAYRAIVYRPIVDLAIFVLILGLLSLLTGRPGS